MGTPPKFVEMSGWSSCKSANKNAGMGGDSRSEHAHMAGLWCDLLSPPPPKKKKKEAQVTSPTACGALFSARTTPQPSQNLVEPWWSPGRTLVEPSWNLTSRPPRTTPELIWAETPKLDNKHGTTIQIDNKHGTF